MDPPLLPRAYRAAIGSISPCNWYYLLLGQLQYLGDMLYDVKEEHISYTELVYLFHLQQWEVLYDRTL